MGGGRPADRGDRRGLDFAHAQGVLHRDLKPANVLLDAAASAVLTDFGFARPGGRQQPERQHERRRHGGHAGLHRAGGLGGRTIRQAQTDVYALGCIVYEMVSGSSPFSGATTPAVMLAHFQPRKLPERWPEGTPAGLGDVLAVALAKAPADRYAQAGELAAAVAA